MNAEDNDLKRAVSRCEEAEKICAAMVIWGLLVEVIAAALHMPIDSFRGTFCAIWADELVVLGVIGEAVFGNIGKRCQSELQRRSDIELGKATKQAGEANERAANAELRTEALRAQSRPRIFNFDRAAMITALDGKPKVPIEILFDADESDASLLATAIYGAFRGASWAATLPAPIPDDPPAPIGLEGAYASGPKHFIQGMQAWGLSVVKRASDQNLESFEAVQHALALSTGQMVSGAENDFVPLGMIRVMIGPRP
jgi:hypothetical protein